MHGYEMMKALEERSNGFYIPSAGTIYPTLQMLEDRGLVTSAEADGKKVYSITDAGRAQLNEREKGSEEFDGPPWARNFAHQRNRWNTPEIQALRSEAMEVARLFTIAGRTAIDSPEKITQLRGIIERSRKELSELIYNEGAKAEPGSGPETAQD
jgi:DNA-binding PadR family transcriptional regulator